MGALGMQLNASQKQRESVATCHHPQQAFGGAIVLGAAVHAMAREAVSVLTH
jgi:hypothetical protein